MTPQEAQEFLRSKARLFPQRNMVGYGVGQSDQFLKPSDLNQPWFPGLEMQDNEPWANLGVPLSEIPDDVKRALLAAHPQLAGRFGMAQPETVNLLEQGGARMSKLARKSARRRPRQAPQPQDLQSIFLADQPLL